VALHDPAAAYTAANNIEAHLLCTLLGNAGVEAHTVEDASQVGTWWAGGSLPGLHRPQVWVDRADLERARSLLEEYEQRQDSRRPGRPSDDGPVEAECEDCGKTSVFPAKHRGTVQNCPYCGAFVDVGAGEDDWEEAEWEEGEAEDKVVLVGRNQLRSVGGHAFAQAGGCPNRRAAPDTPPRPVCEGWQG
jgi:hypothetical protein